MMTVIPAACAAAAIRRSSVQRRSRSSPSAAAVARSMASSDLMPGVPGTVLVPRSTERSAQVDAPSAPAARGLAEREQRGPVPLGWSQLACGDEDLVRHPDERHALQGGRSSRHRLGARAAERSMASVLARALLTMAPQPRATSSKAADAGSRTASFTMADESTSVAPSALIGPQLAEHRRRRPRPRGRGSGSRRSRTWMVAAVTIDGAGAPGAGGAGLAGPRHGWWQP